MDYIALPENAARQLIDSLAVYEEYSRVKARAHPYEGGMYWKKQGEHTYLVKTLSHGVQKRLGPWSRVLEANCEAYLKRKYELEARLASLRSELNDSERLNKALRVGRVPSTVVDVLNVIEDAGLYDNYTVVGTKALYAYETAAGVRAVRAAVATQDVDLLWDARKRVSFISKMKALDTSMLAIIQRADPTFERMEEQVEVAVNSKGFKVEFLRRMVADGDPNPAQLSSKEDDLFAIQANKAGVLTSAPPFEQIIVSTTGGMVRMKTIDPAVFVSFKRWMGTTAPNREPIKKRRDLLQAMLVESLMKDGLLLSNTQRPDADQPDKLEAEELVTKPAV